MLKEFAVEPAAMGSSWENFRYLMELLTFERGRRISRFPKRWERGVIDAATASGFGQVKLASVVDRLQRAKSSGSLVSSGRSFDPALEWLNNALAQHAHKPFSGIIARANPTNHNAVLLTADVDDGHALIQSTHSLEVPRTGPDLANAIAPLVCSAKEILVIDPYIDWRNVGTAQGYRAFLTEILSRLAASGSATRTIQLHYRTHDSRPPQEVPGRNASQRLGALLPQGFYLELFEWQQRQNGEDFHDRHIICDCGGLSIGAGFEAVGAHQNARITLEPFDLVQRLKARFTPATAAFDLVGKIIVIAADGSVRERGQR